MQAGDIEQLVALLSVAAAKDCAAAAKNCTNLLRDLAKLLSNHDDPSTQAFNQTAAGKAGAVPLVLALAKSNDAALQQQAVKTLGNLVRQHHDNKHAAQAGGAISVLSPLKTSKDSVLAQNARKTLELLPGAQIDIAPASVGGGIPLFASAGGGRSSASSDERSFATSRFILAYKASKRIKHQHDLFVAILAFLKAMCKIFGIPEQAAEDLFDRLQGESFENPQELLLQVSVAATRIWTSTQQLKGNGVPDAFNVEFCSLVNRALRDDIAEVMPHLVVIVRAINALCIVGRKSSLLKFPPDNVSHRGGALPPKYHDFFTKGKMYRVPMYLATSFRRDKAYEFWCRALCLPPMSRRPPQLWSGIASLPKAKCQCTGSSTSTSAASTTWITAART